MTEYQAIMILEEEKTLKSDDRKIDAFNMGIKTLYMVSRIAEIIKKEQQATSCEYTKIKSFEKIERIITDYQCEYGAKSEDMTMEEALIELSYDETAYGGKCTPEVRKIAIESVKKQIANQPIEKKSTEKIHYCCSNCGFIALTIYANGYRLGNQPKYCEKCGQAFEWKLDD